LLLRVQERSDLRGEGVANPIGYDDLGVLLGGQDVVDADDLRYERLKDAAIDGLVDESFDAARLIGRVA